MMKTPIKTTYIMRPSEKMVVTSIECKVCHWSCEAEPLHLDVYETQYGRPSGPTISHSTCYKSEIVDGYAIFKLSDAWKMNDEQYGLAFYTNSEELALFNDEGEPLIITTKNGWFIPSSEVWTAEPQEDFVFKLDAARFKS